MADEIRIKITVDSTDVDTRLAKIKKEGLSSEKVIKNLGTTLSGLKSQSRSISGIVQDLMNMSNATRGTADKVKSISASLSRLGMASNDIAKTINSLHSLELHVSTLMKATQEARIGNQAFIAGLKWVGNTSLDVAKSLGLTINYVKRLTSEIDLSTIKFREFARLDAFTKIGKELRAVVNETKKLNAEWVALERASKIDPAITNFKNFANTLQVSTKSMRTLNNQMALFAQKSKELDAAAKAMNASNKSIGEFIRSLQTSTYAMKTLNAQMDLFASKGANAAVGVRNIAAFANSVKRSSTAMQVINSHMELFAKKQASFGQATVHVRTASVRLGEFARAIQTSSFAMNTLNSSLDLLRQKTGLLKAKSDAYQARQAITELGEAVSQTEKKIGFLGRTAIRVGQYMATAFGMKIVTAIASFGANLSKVSSDFLGFRNALMLVDGSMDNANSKMKDAITIAMQLKLDINSVTKEYSKFVNAATIAGVSVEKATQQFKSFAIAARVMNLDGQQVSGMFLALEQMISKGFVSMEELRRQLGQYIPGAMALAAKAWGDGEASIAEFYDAVKKGTLESVPFLEKFAKLIEERVAGTLPVALKKSSAAFQDLYSSMYALQVTLGLAIQAPLAAIAEAFSSTIKIIGRTVSAFNDLGDVLSPAFDPSVPKEFDALEEKIETIGDRFRKVIGPINSFKFVLKETIVILSSVTIKFLALAAALSAVWAIGSQIVTLFQWLLAPMVAAKIAVIAFVAEGWLLFHTFYAIVGGISLLMTGFTALVAFLATPVGIFAMVGIAIAVATDYIYDFVTGIDKLEDKIEELHEPTLNLVKNLGKLSKEVEETITKLLKIDATDAAAGLTVLKDQVLGYRLFILKIEKELQNVDLSSSYGVEQAENLLFQLEKAKARFIEFRAELIKSRKEWDEFAAASIAAMKTVVEASEEAISILQSGSYDIEMKIRLIGASDVEKELNELTRAYNEAIAQAAIDNPGNVLKFQEAVAKLGAEFTKAYAGITLYHEIMKKREEDDKLAAIAADQLATKISQVTEAGKALAQQILDQKAKQKEWILSIQEEIAALNQKIVTTNLAGRTLALYNIQSEAALRLSAARLRIDDMENISMKRKSELIVEALGEITKWANTATAAFDAETAAKLRNASGSGAMSAADRDAAAAKRELAAATLQAISSQADWTKNIDKQIKSVRDQTKAVGLTGKALSDYNINIKRTNSIEEMSQRIKEEGNKIWGDYTVVIEENTAKINELADAEATLYDENAIQKHLKSAGSAASSATEAVSEMANEWTSIFEDLGKGIEDILVDTFSGTFDSFKDLTDAIKDVFRNLLRDLIRYALRNPINIGMNVTGGGATGGAGSIFDLFGGSGGSGGTGGTGGISSFLFEGIGGIIDAWTGAAPAATSFTNSAGLVAQAPPVAGPGGWQGLAGAQGAGGTLLSVAAAGALGYGIGSVIGGEKYGGISGAVGGAAGAWGASAAGLAGTTGAYGALAATGWGAIAAVVIALISKMTEDENANSELTMFSGDYGGMFGASSKDAQGNLIKDSTGARTGVWRDLLFGGVGAKGQHIGNPDDDQIPTEEFQNWLDNMGVAFDAMGELDKAAAEVFGLSEESILKIKTEVEGLAKATEKMGTPSFGEFVIERYNVVFKEIGGLADKMWEGFKSEGLDDETALQAVDAIIMLNAELLGLRNVSETAATMIADASLTTYDLFLLQREGIYEMIDAYDGTLTSTQSLTAGLDAQRQSTLNLLVAIDAISKGIDAMFGNTKEKIMTDTMTDEEKFNYYKGQADVLTASLATMVDPAKIKTTTEEINRLIGLTWGLQMAAGEDEAQIKQQEYLDYLDSLNALAQSRLNIAEQEAVTEAARLADAVETAIIEGIAPITEAAENMAETSGDLTDAAASISFSVDAFGRNVGMFGGFVDSIDSTGGAGM